MVRVKVGSIYHYGIFVSEGEVVQFGLAPSARPDIKAADIEVCSSDIDEFLLGGFLEVAEFDRLERRKNRKPREIVNVARGRIGERGYDLLYNNCEHFAYECVTGKKYSSQTELVRAHFRSMPVVDIYLCAIPEDVEYTPITPKEREDEIASVSNPKIKAEKYCVWRLLEYALERTFGYKMDNLSFKKTENGKWTCDKCEISLSHCDGVAAVAVSRAPVGIDVEAPRPTFNEKFAARMLTNEERTEYGLAADDEKAGYLLAVWTKKESLFKRDGKRAFCPSSFDTTKANVLTKTVKVRGRDYCVSVATDTPDSVRSYVDVDIFKR